MRYRITLKKDWFVKRDKLKRQFLALTDEDLQVEGAGGEDVLDRLQRKLGKTKQEIINLLNRL